MYNPFTSRTNWIQVGIIVLAVVNALIPFLPTQYQDLVTALLGVLAIYTHTSGMKKAVE